MTIHTEFNPFSATVTQWEDLLTRSSSNQKDFFMGASDTTPLKRELETIVRANLDLADRKQIVDNVVNAALNQWQVINDSDRISERATARGHIHPLLLIPKIAYVDGEPHDELKPIITLLWSKPAKDDVFKRVRPILEIGLGIMVLYDNFDLETLYRTQFEEYQFFALEVLLDRDEIVTASRLFIEYAGQYPDYDPGCFDRLVARGLAPSDAERWLDVSLKRSNVNNTHQTAARRRWSIIAAQRT